MTWERYTGATQTGLEVIAWTGPIFNPRSYCDDPTVGVVGIYIAKAPVCHLKLTPRTQFENTNIAWDISASGSTTSTIATFDITWGGTTDIGDLAAQSWGGAKSGNVQFTTAGIYTVEATVTDLLGAVSSPSKQTIYIAIGPGPIAYIAAIGSTNQGVYVHTNAGGLVSASSGLAGGYLNIRAIRLHPAYKDLPTAKQHIWIATEDGVAYSTTGATTWTTVSKADLGTPANTVGDSPAPATAALDQIDIAFDPQDPQRVYVFRGITTPNLRTWLYYSEDYGATWNNNQIYQNDILVEDSFNSNLTKVIQGADETKAVVAYKRVSASYPLYVKIVSIPSGVASASLSFGGLSTDGGQFSIDRMDADYAVVIWNSKTGASAAVFVDLWDISGSEVTEATDDLMIENWSGGGANTAICAASSTVAFGIFYNGAVASGRLVELGRSGATLTETSTDDITLANTILDIGALTATKVIAVYLDGSNYPTATAIETSGGTSQGAAATLESTAFTGSLSVIALSGTLAVAMYSGSGVIHLTAMTISGTTITVGTPLVISAASSVVEMGMGFISATSLAVNFYDDTSNLVNVYSVSGTTLSLVSSRIVSDVGDLVILDSGEIALSYIDSNDVRLESIAGIAFNQSGIPGGLM